MNIVYRVVTDNDSLEQVVDLEIAIWGLHPRDAVPTHLYHSLALNGGVLVVAEADSQLVGFCLGFSARQLRSWYLWSVMAGVHPDFQGHGIGFQLKQAQRDWALDNGFKEIRWTYDPLQRGNANFNIHKLGATASQYHINYYGEMADGINAGLPSDRLEVSWQLKRKVNQKVSTPSPSIDKSAFSLISDSENRPRRYLLDSMLTACYIEIPPNIGQLKRENPELALEWRLALRDVLVDAFQRGYSITDFLSENGRCYYQLTLPQPWYLYVVECADQSLYTGITPDVAERITKHNAGKGAAYTATRSPVKLLAAWKFANRSLALKAEAAFKKQSRPVKISQVAAQSTFHGGIFVKSP